MLPVRGAMTGPAAVRALCALVSLLAVACSTEDDGPHGPEGLVLTAHDTSIQGTFGLDGMVVAFTGSSDPGQRAELGLDIDGSPLDISVDIASQMLTEDAHGSSFDFDDRALLLGLRDAVSDEHPEVMETLHGMLLVKAADRFAEMPIGPSLVRRETEFDPEEDGKADAVTSGCGGDGTTCLPGTHGTSWAIFSAGGVCRAESTPYGDSVCRGRCGAGCNWFDEDYTYDCLDHDVCLDYSNDCGDEFNDAADDWVATLAPLCWSGTSRSRPPLVPVCGNGSTDVGEECDDHNVNSGDSCDGNCTWPRCGNRITAGAEQCDDGNTSAGDGCSATCMIEIPAPRLAAFGPALSSITAGDVDVVPQPDLRVTLDRVAPEGGTTVTLSSASPEVLAVAGSVTVPAGALDAQVAVTGLAAGRVTLTATLDGGALTVEVDVIPAPVLDIDIGGWQLRQTASARTFTFPAGTMVAPGDYVIVCRNADRAAFEAFWGVSLGDDVVFLNAMVAGGAEWPSINGAETFELRDGAGSSIDGPSIALRAGMDLQRTEPGDAPGLEASWTSTPAAAGGPTPGAGQEPSGDSSGLYVSECSDANGAGNYVYEFVELYFD